MKRIPIIFSTITGNGFKLADKIKDGVDHRCGPYNIRYITQDVIDKFDTFILVYWCDLGSADKDTLELISKMKDKNILILGTFGMNPDTQHAQHIFSAVNEVVSLNNNLLGHYLCQGSIDLARAISRVKNPDPNKPILRIEKFEEYLSTINHPTEEALEEALKFVRSKFNKSISLND